MKLRYGRSLNSAPPQRSDAILAIERLAASVTRIDMGDHRLRALTRGVKISIKHARFGPILEFARRPFANVEVRFAEHPGQITCIAPDDVPGTITVRCRQPRLAMWIDSGSATGPLR